MLSPAAICEDRASQDYLTSESALASLWKRSHTLKNGLVTQDGRRFRVVYPGRQNPRAGPDFHNAVLLTESGIVITGDVELHMNAPDWYAHGHHDDPNYNGVVLHVVLRPKGDTHTKQLSGLKAPVLSLSSAVDSLSHGVESQPIETLSRLQSLDEASLLTYLEGAGDRRFMAKSRGFAVELRDMDAEQVLYCSLMESLGYVSNRKPFRQLAGRVPISTMNCLHNEPASVRLLSIRALLFAGAGLMRYVEANEAEAMRRMLKHLPSIRAMQAKEWKLFRVRPSNHPAMRIEGAAGLIERFLDNGIVEGIADAVSSNSKDCLLKSLSVDSYIGKGRAADIAVNVALPFLHAYGQFGGAEKLKGRAVELFEGFPKLQENEITREMRRLLPNLAASAIKSASQQQGLIQLYRDMTRQSLSNAL